MGGSQIVVRGIVVGVIALAATVTGGCTHRWWDDTRAYSSLKDDNVPKPVAKVATPSRRTTTGSIDSRLAPAAAMTVKPVEAPPLSSTATNPSAPPAPAPTSPIETANIDRSNPVPEAAEIQAANDRARLESRIISLQLLEEGERLVSMGRVIEGRTRLFAAMDGASPEVLLALARSFDTYYLGRLASSDGLPDRGRALSLYQRAVERGSTPAVEDLARLASTPPSSEPSTAPPASQN